MTAYFSDNITGSGANTTLDTQYRAPVGIRHARERVAIARCTGLFLTSDVVRMITLKSSDRLLSLGLATDGACNAGAVDIGVYLTGTAHAGAVEDAETFSQAVVVSSETDLIDIFDEMSYCDGVDRGRTMWELVTLGGGTNYTVDPNVEFDICITPSTSLTTSPAELTLQAIYTSGD